MRSFALLPAAGSSRRMGRPKLLLPWEQTTLIEHVLARWQASRVDRVLVIVRPDDTALADVCQRAGAVVVRAAFDPPEMKDSIQLGLQFVAAHEAPDSDDVWLIAPCDLPDLSAPVVDQLLSAAEAERAETLQGPRSIWVPCHGAKRGHPVLFPWSLAGEVSQLGPHEGLNALVARHPCRTIDAGPAAVSGDIDTPEEYRRRQGPA